MDRRALKLLPLAMTIFCCVSGGPFGLEPVMAGGPRYWAPFDPGRTLHLGHAERHDDRRAFQCDSGGRRVLSLD